MAVVNMARKTVQFKIVYYGPALCGKTTNLEYIHANVETGKRGDLVSLGTNNDRTLFFDFLPLTAGSVNGFETKFQLYTVPGQVIYDATRKLVLRGTDGVVFVADSQPEKLEENTVALQEMFDYLAGYAINPYECPLVFQYNKRDLPSAMPRETLDYYLNGQNYFEVFEASAASGQMVFETLNRISEKIFLSFVERQKASGFSI
ncbi:MAG: GTPase domain-containing protein [Verrucomicrobiota bacterium]|nr:GTPase domain-containing protein [Verrucomicrobiota bacterium]